LRVVDAAFRNETVRHENLIQFFGRLLGFVGRDRPDGGNLSRDGFDLGLVEITQNFRCRFFADQHEERRGQFSIAILHLFFSSVSQTRTSLATVSGSVCACSTTRLRIKSIFVGVGRGRNSRSGVPAYSSFSRVPFSCASSCFTVIGVWRFPAVSLGTLRAPAALLPGAQLVNTVFCTGRRNNRYRRTKTTGMMR